MPWLLWGHLVGASGHEVFSLKIFSLKWNLLHGQAVSSSTAPFLSLVAESIRLFMLQSIGGIGKSATSGHKHAPYWNRTLANVAKRPALQQKPNVNLEPKWLRCQPIAFKRYTH